jgi:hypothetical protein
MASATSVAAEAKIGEIADDTVHWMDGQDPFTEADL